MEKSKKQITDELRDSYTKKLAEFFSTECDTDVCRTAAGTIMIPVVDSEGEDRWVKISVIIPKEATEENGTDGYSLQQEYQLKIKAAETRRAEREAASKTKKSKTQNSSEVKS